MRRHYRVLLTAVCASLFALLALWSAGGAQPTPQAVLSFEEPACVNMPVWVHVSLAKTQNLSLIYVNMRYPYSGVPSHFGGHTFQVMRDGALLPQIKCAVLHGRINGLGSAAPETSPKHRFPLHLHYRFDRPGKYLIRYEYRERWSPDSTVTVCSDWTELDIRPFTEAQRQAWMQEKLANPPEDVGLLVGDYLPSLLAKPDNQVFNALLPYLYHSNELVQHFAGYSLYYFPDDKLRLEMPRVLRENGVTDFIAHVLSWRRKLFAPVGEEIVNAIIPHLRSDSSSKVGGAIRALVFLRAYDWPAEANIPEQIGEAVWGAVDHIRAFHDREALHPFCLFLGGIKSDQSRKLLWELAENPSVREQSLICLSWIGDARDLPRLGALLLTDEPGSGPLPYHLRRAWGADAISYLLQGLHECPDYTVRLRCAKELALENRPEAFALFAEVMEKQGYEYYRQYVVQFLVDRFGLKRPCSDDEVIKFINVKTKEIQREPQG